jgi:hypothetical protein
LRKKASLRSNPGDFDNINNAEFPKRAQRVPPSNIPDQGAQMLTGSHHINFRLADDSPETGQ